MSIVLRVEPMPGGEDAEAAKVMHRLALELGIMVVCNINGAEMIATPKIAPETSLEQWRLQLRAALRAAAPAPAPDCCFEGEGDVAFEAALNLTDRFHETRQERIDALEAAHRDIIAAADYAEQVGRRDGAGSYPVGVMDGFDAAAAISRKALVPKP